MSEPRAEYIVAGDDAPEPESDFDRWARALMGAGMPHWLAQAILAQVGQIRADARWLRGREARLEADREALRELRCCEAWPVIGLDDTVDVRMPADVWERVKAAAKGESTR